MPNTPEYLTTLALNVKLFAILKSLRRQESSYFLWFPVFAETILDSHFRRDFKMANNFTLKASVVKYSGVLGIFYMIDPLVDSFYCKINYGGYYMLSVIDKAKYNSIYSHKLSHNNLQEGRAT